MIRNNLAALMGERGLKITRVAKETGISRNTITSIAQNDSDMIRMETINTICKYLGVTPCEFYEYEPFDIEFSVYITGFVSYFNADASSFSYIRLDEMEADIILDVIKQNNKQSFDLTCSLITKNAEITFFGSESLIFNIDFNDEKKDLFLSEVYNKINAAFHQDIYNSLTYKIYKAIVDHTIEEYKDSYLSQSDKKDLGEIVKTIKINIESDVFKKF